VVNSARPILFFIPLLVFMPRFLGINGVWLSFAVADLLSFLLTVFLLIPQMRTLRSLDPAPGEVG
jgi:Na+-driven multidrug efflux pump